MKIDFCWPNAEICRKMANGRLLLLALFNCIMQCPIYTVCNTCYSIILPNTYVHTVQLEGNLIHAGREHKVYR